jgi:3D (Asp-Asp-Asp) domain-containing protein
MTNENDEPEGIAGGAIGAVAAVGAALRPIVRSAVGMLAEFYDRIVHGIRCLAPVGLGLGLGLGCEPTNEPVEVAPPAVERIPASSVPRPDDTGPRPLGKFTITFYYVIGEDEVTAKSRVAANDNRAQRGADRGDGEEANRAGSVGDVEDDVELAAITSPPVTLYAGGGGCEPIAEVTKDFATQLAIQGTGKLRDGRMLNIWGACNCKHTPCFKVTRAQWGMAGTGKPLQPFRTIAVDPRVVKLGSLLYVPLLEGRTMPGRSPWGGYVHDGCVVADDTGGHIAGNRIDLFVGRKGYFLGLSGSGGSHAWARHVPVFDGSEICQRKGRQVGRKAASI